MYLLLILRWFVHGASSSTPDCIGAPCWDAATAVASSRTATVAGEGRGKPPPSCLLSFVLHLQRLSRPLGHLNRHPIVASSPVHRASTRPFNALSAPSASSWQLACKFFED